MCSMEKEKICFNEKLLNEMMVKYSANLKGTYDKFSSDIKVNFICKCGNDATKTFKNIALFGGALCENCTKIDRSKKIEKKKSDFNKILLDEIICKYGATKIKEYEKLYKETVVTFLCACGAEGSKSLKSIVKCGALCKNCTEINKSKKREETNIEKYGVAHSTQNKEIKEKTLNTIREKFGVDNVFQSKEIKEKILNTIRERFGVDNPGQNKEIKEKILNTVRERFGVDNPGQNKEIREKMKNTTKERFGVDHALQNDDIKEKAKKTIQEKYGVDSPSQNTEIKEKMKNTVRKNFGVDHPAQNKEISEKIATTNKEKYGTTCPLQNDEIKEKTKKTIREKYGVDNVFQNAEIKETIKNTVKEKFGVDSIFQSDEIKEKIKNTMQERYGVDHPSQNAKIHSKMMKSSYSHKDYRLPSGKILSIQGYEHFGFDELIQKENIAEKDIENSHENVPEIWYYDEQEKKHRHFVDIFIPSQNRCIEIKSPWTIKSQKDNIFLKQDAAKSMGYKYEIWVYNAKGVKVECHV